MADLAYILCALTSIGCAILLLRGYKQSGSRLLFWSGLCFVGLALNNVILFADLFIVPELELDIWRSMTALVALTLMLVGLIWEAT